jgi:hypothetical protein
VPTSGDDGQLSVCQQTVELYHLLGTWEGQNVVDPKSETRRARGNR